MRAIKAIKGAALLCGLAWQGAATAASVASLNLCTDQYLLRLAPERAQSVSFLARDPSLSSFASRAQAIPINEGRIEELMRAQPDLILAGPYGAQMTLRLLRDKGWPILRMNAATDFNAIRADALMMGERLGAQNGAQEWLRTMDALLAEARAAPLPPWRALIVGANGYVQGEGTLGHAVMQAAGLRNAAADASIRGYVPLGLEEILRLAPAVILHPANDAAAPSLAQHWLTHPMLDRLAARSLAFAPHYLTCGTPETAQLVRQIQDALRP